MEFPNHRDRQRKDDDVEEQVDCSMRKKEWRVFKLDIARLDLESEVG